VVLSWYCRDTVVLLSWYWRATEMAPQERSLIALGLPGAKHQRGRRPAALYTPGGFSIPLYLRERGRHVMSGVSEFRPFPAALPTRTFLKASSFGLVLSSFAPSPIMPAGKLNTTPTVLSSGEALKKRNIVWILLDSSPVPASLSAPGGSRSSLFSLLPANCWSAAKIPPTAGLPRPLRRGPTANCLLPTAPCP